MRRDDRIFRVASQLHRCLTRVHSGVDDPFSHQMNDLLVRQGTLGHLLRQTDRATRHSWHLAAQRLKADVSSELRAVASSCQELLKASAPREVPVISLQNLIDDLQQLQAEFEDVDLSQRGRIIVTSGPVELEGISLGRFAMELHFSRLGEQPSSSCFDCDALDPNPASGNEDVTHPHVQAKNLCAGDATVPIASALGQGRICDAFCLVHSVLQTYNPNSPFISLSNWDGVSCSDCGYSTDRDNLYFCDGCSNDYCEECISSCDLCGTSRCDGCLERDEISDQRCCASCREKCTTCKRLVDKDSFDPDSGLCPGCLEEQTTDRAQEDELEPPTDAPTLAPNQENDDEYDLMPTLCSHCDPITATAGDTTTVHPPANSAA
jgi:hypothetical protein